MLHMTGGASSFLFRDVESILLKAMKYLHLGYFAAKIELFFQSVHSHTVCPSHFLQTMHEVDNKLPHRDFDSNLLNSQDWVMSIGLYQHFMARQGVSPIPWRSRRRCTTA